MDINRDDKAPLEFMIKLPLVVVRVMLGFLFGYAKAK